jgi:hypothetical protein
MGWTGTMDANLGGKGLAKAEHEQASDLANLQQQRAQLVAKGKVTASVDKQISDARDSLQNLQSLQKNGVPSNIVIQKPMIDSDLPWLSDAVNKAKANPELLFFKIKTNAYKFSWALIPISVPFVWLLFPFSRRFKLYDHTVFVTYSLCFMMLLLSAGTLVALVWSSLAGLFWFVPPIHIYRQLKGAYSLRRWGAAWRTAVLSIFAFIAISLFASLLVTLGALD